MIFFSEVTWKKRLQKEIPRFWSSLKRQSNQISYRLNQLRLLQRWKPCESAPMVVIIKVLSLRCVCNKKYVFQESYTIYQLYFWSMILKLISLKTSPIATDHPYLCSIITTNSNKNHTYDYSRHSLHLSLILFMSSKTYNII